MDRIDDMLTRYFAAGAEPPRRALRPSVDPAGLLAVLAANPVPLIVPCHRIVRGDGTWGNYALGPRLKTALLTLERRVPLLVGCVTTRIVCRRGCAHEQRIGEARRVVFASVGDARSVGYRPCRTCRPAA